MEVKPGEFLTVFCPEGQRAQVEVGQKIPATQPAVTVIRVDENKILLGPLRAGKFSLEVPCADSSLAKVEYELKALKKEEAPKKEPLLAPFALGYPLWLWLALALLVAALVAGIFYFRRRARKKQVRILPPAPQMSPREKLQNFLQEVSKGKVYESDDEASILVFYQQGYESLRRFLEERLELKTRFETTREFIGTLRAAAPQWKIAKGTVDEIEGLLTQSDDVRFAHAKPAAENRKYFFDKMQDIYKKLGPGTNPADLAPGGR